MATRLPNPDLTPAMNPPPGVTQNLIDPPSQGYVTIVVMVIFICITTPFVLVRMYTRHFVNRRLWWDDYACVIAWIGLFGATGILLKSLSYGSGVDLWNVSATHGALYTKLFSKFEIIARISMTFTKLSILLLFLRIFVPPQTKKTGIYYSIWVVIWFIVLYCIALVLVVLLQCVGKVEVPGKTCIDTFSLLVTASLINVLSDIVMLIIPVVAVWGLRMPLKRKLGLSVVFAVGALAVGSSIARLGWQIQRARDPNRTMVLMKVALLAMAEHTTGIIVGCMPVLPALYRQISLQRSQSRSSKVPGDSWRTALSSNTLVNRNARHARVSSKDPYLVSMDYKELNDMENGHGPPMEIKGTTTTIDGGRDNTSTPVQTVEGLHGSPETSALVSKSVQVVSHPRDMEENRLLPPPAHLRN